MAFTQGPVPLRDEESYVERAFEGELLDEWSSGNWVALLGPRQHGKTSALLRFKQLVADSGLPVALVDLQKAPPLETYKKFASWFAETAKAQLNPGGEQLPNSDDVGILLMACLPSDNLAATVIVDEAANIKETDWRNSFYGQLRSISNRRADAPPEDPATRLRLIFSGTFHPDTLIELENSPFNTTERINTDDLTEGGVIELFERELGGEGEPLAKQAYAVVGGQPFLVQRLLVAATRSDDRAAGMARAVEKLRHGEVDHVVHLFGRVLESPKLAEIVGKMAATGSIPNEPDKDFQSLQILGIAKREGQNLVFRNRLYQEIAALSVQLRPEVAEVDAGGGAYVPLKESAFAFIDDLEYREIAMSAHNGAVNAMNSTNYRLAVVGFGVALEAVLIDWLVRRPGGDLTTAIASAKTAAQKSDIFISHENASDASTWRLINLVRVAKELNGIRGKLEVPDSLREMRNLVHPREMKNHYLPEKDLRPEAVTASGLISQVMRDIQT